MKGYVQVYTGSGKGKTTAALGLLLRACGAGLRVYFCQFLKCRTCSEIKAIRERFPEVTLACSGLGHFIRGTPTPDDIQSAHKGLEALMAALRNGAYDVVIADEANVAAHMGLVTVNDLLALIDAKPDTVELILTGRNAHPDIIQRADLVTEMTCHKHYYDRGVPARPGIED